MHSNMPAFIRSQKNTKFQLHNIHKYMKQVIFLDVVNSKNFRCSCEKNELKRNSCKETCSLYKCTNSIIHIISASAWSITSNLSIWPANLLPKNILYNFLSLAPLCPCHAMWEMWSRERNLMGGDGVWWRLAFREKVYFQNSPAEFDNISIFSLLCMRPSRSFLVPFFKLVTHPTTFFLCISYPVKCIYLHCTLFCFLNNILLPEWFL